MGGTEQELGDVQIVHREQVANEHVTLAAMLDLGVDSVDVGADVTLHVIVFRRQPTNRIHEETFLLAPRFATERCHTYATIHQFVCITFALTDQITFNVDEHVEGYIFGSSQEFVLSECSGNEIVVVEDDCAHLAQLDSVGTNKQ